MAGRQALDRWIREVLTDEELRRQYGKCTRLAVVHVSGGGPEQEVYTVTLTGKQWDPTELEKLFREKAEDHCSELPGHQTYNVLAFYDDRNVPSVRRAFGAHGAVNAEEPEYLTEGPTAKGLVAQAMRHNEVLAKTYTTANASLLDGCTRVLGRISDLLEKRDRESNEMFTLLREAAMERITQNNEHELKRIKLQSGEDIKQSLARLVPALVNGFTGKEIFPAHLEDSTIISEMAEQLSEQDMMYLANTLQPKLMGLLAKRMTKITDNKSKVRQDVERAIKGNGADIEDAELSAHPKTEIVQ